MTTSLWQPDFVIINLGTDDSVAFHQPEWKEEETGKTWKQRINLKGQFEPEDIKRFVQKVIEFLITLRKCNAKAEIIWAYGIYSVIIFAVFL